MQITIMGFCPICDKKWEIDVEEEDWELYQRGNSNVQDVFHYLSDHEREYLITGWCNGCQDKMFVDDEPEEDIVWIP